VQKLELHCPEVHAASKYQGSQHLNDAVAGDLCFLSNMKYAAQAEKTWQASDFCERPEL